MIYFDIFDIFDIFESNRPSTRTYEQLELGEVRLGPRGARAARLHAL